MEEVKTVKNVKEILDLALAMVDIGVLVAKDGKIGLDDAALLFKLIPVVGPALEGVSEVPSELSDLSDEEATDLVVQVMTKLAVEDEKAKLIVAASLKSAVSVWGLIKAIKE